jgi:cytochrome c peroxidase
LGVSVLLIGSESAIPFEQHPISFKVPKGWPKPIYKFKNNMLTEEGFELGKKLFYDGRLSKNGEFSCGSCHQPFAAFAHFDHDLSHGVNDQLSNRNAPALINVAWMKEMHWDGAINHIEVQPLAPITDPKEMGEQLDSVLQKLKNDTSYVRMFKEAFGTPEINSQKMLRALAQFVASLVSSNSRFDRFQRGEATLTNYELKGYQHFKTHCSSCHKEPLFTDNNFHNNGQKLNRFKDIGRMKVTGNPMDSLKFKTPTLRNVQITYPYMHDGHIYSLSQAIDHYAQGIDTGMINLDPALRKKIVLTKKEKMELVYFLYTLTDSSFINNPRFAAPRPLTIGHDHR